ncbi:hypothetical protein [Brevibacterium sp. HMSC22B09]|uniref:hypothetical protein n=1 Tax=Brevibacterium sp. HMSC22B09 TaxID=1581055 RepID=UPI0008A5B2B0|nr:hypothetical protein [Brevibacterium sp. HMSC22B09]OFT96224.1 hypothetical protein HMPREF3087_08115 [Brevibacterium sp. HMSC22B09]
MSTITLHPFPRLTNSQLNWTPFALMLNGAPTDIMDLADDWDPNSKLTISAAVTINDLNRDELRAPETSVPVLKLTVACQDTATTFVGEVVLDESADHRCTGSVELDIDTEKIENQLIVQAVVVLPVSGGAGRTVPWLNNRIIAESRQLRIGLSAENRGFPTSAASFKEEGWYAAPWRFDLECSDLSDTFNNSIRLYLNQDDKNVLELVKSGKPKDLREQLVASIHRVMLLTAERLSHSYGPKTSSDQIAETYPDSIAAAARRSAVEHLGLESLDEALSLIRENPEELEYLIMAKTFRT